MKFPLSRQTLLHFSQVRVSVQRVDQKTAEYMRVSGSLRGDKIGNGDPNQQQCDRQRNPGSGQHMDGFSILENNSARNLARTVKLLARMRIYIYNDGMNQAGHLHRLQRIDTQLSHIEGRVKEIDRLLAEDERLVTAKYNSETARTHLEKARLTLRSAEHTVSEQQLKIEQTNSTLYSGTVRNPKELQDLQKEIISLKKYLETLEDQQLQAMMDLEEAEQVNQIAQAELIRVQAEVIQSKAGFSGERDQLLSKQESLSAERLAALTAITPVNLDLYDHLRSLKGGLAVTTVEDETCTLCGAPIRLAEGQMARMQTSLVYCSSCSRIIFAG